MAGRNVKRGLLFFRLDCDILRDRKIKRLLRRYDSDGLLVYICLLCEIYRDNGYYLNMDDDVVPDIADTCGLDENRAADVLRECVSLGLFDSMLLASVGVLTSRGIQARYLDIMAGLRRKGGISSELSLISSEEIRKSAESLQQDSETLSKIVQSAEDCRISSDNREDKRRIEKKVKNTHTHTTSFEEGGAGEETKPDSSNRENSTTCLKSINTELDPPRMESPKGGDRDEYAMSAFGRAWSELTRPQKMMLWAKRVYPIFFEFERPLTLENCESIVKRFPDWRDIDRVCEAVANRRDVLTNHVSAISTFNAFARMDYKLREKQRL